MFLRKSLDLIRKLALKSLLLCLFYQDLLVWVPRSMFSNSWHEISDLINVSYDLCIHFVHVLEQRETQVFPGSICPWMWPSEPHLGERVWNLGQDLDGAQHVLPK